MKKIISILMIFSLIFALSACGNTANNDDGENVPSSSSSLSETKENESSELVEEEPTSPENLANDGYSIVVALKKSDIVINSIEDFEQYSVAYIIGTDGEKYAEFYAFDGTGMYNAANDLHSGVMGGQYDLGIVKADNVAGYEDWEVVWNFNEK